jgi:hypothetical protein
MKKYFNKFAVLLFIAALLGIAVRFYHIGFPVADWHSWRQADTAAVARNFLKFGIDPLHPRYDDLSNIQSGKDNPQGWRMVEFPIYQLVAVGLYKTIHSLSIEVCLRFVSILSTAGSIYILGLLLWEMINPWIAVVGSFLYAILPFSIYYGRAILPDPLAIFFALLSLYLLSVSYRNSYRTWIIILAGISAAAAVLIRPMAVFLLFPALYLTMRNSTSTAKSIGRLLLYGVIMTVPLLLWRHWILQFPEGIPASDWLYNKSNIRFKGAWFYWLFSQRLGDLILGYWGLIPFGLGIIATVRKKEGWFSALWLVGGLSYLIIFAGGNVQHDYYQALLLPIVIWFLAKGVGFLLQKKEGIRFVPSIALAVISISFLCAFSWYTMRTYFWINRPEIVEAGRMADKLIPNDAKVIAPYNGDTTFLYQTGRQGWPEGFDIDKKISEGAGYYVTVSPTDSDLETRDLAKTYTVLVRNDKYAIIDLTRKK